MKKFIASAAAALLVAAAFTLVYAPSATATECVPKDAWTEVIEHPAEGEPTITIDNPDYVPAVEEVSHIVHHPAVTDVIHHPDEYVHHEAVYETLYHFAKFTQERSGKKVRGEIQWSEWSAWTKWLPETHTSWETATDALGTPQPHASWTEGNGQHRVYYERQWQAQWDGGTKQKKVKDAWDELVKPAWDETVVITEAWDEKVIDVEGKPAVGEPTIEVENPDYVEAWTEEVEHPAVVCPTPTPTPDPTPTVEPSPDPEPTTDPEPSPSETPAVITPSGDRVVLAKTGGQPIHPLIPIGGVLLVAAGAGVLIRSRLRAQQ